MSVAMSPRFVVLLRRSYCDHDASVFPLRRVSPSRVAYDGAVFHGPVEACEAHAQNIGVSIGTIDEPRGALTAAHAHEIMDRFKAKLHDMDANS